MVQMWRNCQLFKFYYYLHYLISLVLPLVEVRTLEVPDVTSSTTVGALHLLETNESTLAIINETTSFQWACSVRAGQEDELMWIHNGSPVRLETPEVGKVSGLNL